MKKLLIVIAVLGIIASACVRNEKTVWEQYEQYRNDNNAWLADLQGKKNPDGSSYYKTVTADWYPGTFILIHYFNDRSETEGNLSPLYNSTVQTRYHLSLYDGTGVDSSANYVTRLNNTIPGWAMALMQMRCGDTAEVIIPYAAGYGSQSMGSMRPYSNLQFNVRLVDIPYYEAPPYQ